MRGNIVYLFQYQLHEFTVGNFWHHSLDPYLREVPRVSWLLSGSRPNRTYATNAITRPSLSCRNVYYSRVNYLTLHVAVTVQSQIISTVQVNRSQHTREQRFHSSHPWTPVDYEVQLHSTVNYQRQQSTQPLHRRKWTELHSRNELKKREPRAASRYYNILRPQPK